jgi:hypothetical protein
MADAESGLSPDGETSDRAMISVAREAIIEGNGELHQNVSVSWDDRSHHGRTQTNRWCLPDADRLANVDFMNFA